MRCPQIQGGWRPAGTGARVAARCSHTPTACSLLEAALALLPEALASLADGLRAWLCSGACLSPSGAFAAWVDHASGRRSFEYPEISGYALTYLAGLESLLERE